jgi:hypothetical protein
VCVPGLGASQGQKSFSGRPSRAARRVGMLSRGFAALHPGLLSCPPYGRSMREGRCRGAMRAFPGLKGETWGTRHCSRDARMSIDGNGERRAAVLSCNSTPIDPALTYFNQGSEEQPRIPRLRYASLGMTASR